jgi:gamma-glutamyltranspeptidase/glutathione hydrolase
MKAALRAALALCLLLTAGLAPAPAQRVANPNEPPKVAPVFARHGMVVAQEKRAALVGLDVLKRGGNAVDAAVAVGFAMAVTYPRAGNIGGGGFMLIHLAKRNEQFAIDYRETAPAATTPDTYLDAKGEPDLKKLRDLGTAVGVPGTVAGLALAHRKYGSGRFTLGALIGPAILLARDGIPVDDDLLDSRPYAQPLFARWPSSAKFFLHRDGRVLGPRDRLVQSDLAHTLYAIAKNGPRAFYEGPIAQKIAAAVRNAGGLMTTDDLKNYKAVERKPLRGSYRGYDVVSMPPPSSGGVLLLQMLNVLEGYEMKSRDAATMHLMVETMKRAYADRAQYLGDPDTVEVPVAGLASKRYAKMQRDTIDPEKAKPSAEVLPGKPEGDNTTHYSVVDRFGNAVSNTYTLNSSYGNGLIAEGTGVLLNNELDDFAAKPGAPNAFGLVGLNMANAPGPNKRPLSSMTPTIVLKDGKPVLLTGSPGGSRIITAVLQVIVNVIDFKMPVADAVASARLQHQWLPDELWVEPGLPPALLKNLEARGHKVQSRIWGTSANSIEIGPRALIGAADTRTRGALAAGY